MRRFALRFYAVCLVLGALLEVVGWAVFDWRPEGELGAATAALLGRIVWPELTVGIVTACALALGAAAARRGPRVALGIASLLALVTVGFTALTRLGLFDLGGAPYERLMTWFTWRRLFEAASLAAASLGAWGKSPRTSRGIFGVAFGLLAAMLAIAMYDVTFRVHSAVALQLAIRVAGALTVAAIAALADEPPGARDRREPPRGAGTYATFLVALGACASAPLWVYLVRFPRTPTRVDETLSIIVLFLHVLMWPPTLAASRVLDGSSAGRGELAIARAVGWIVTLVALYTIAWDIPGRNSVVWFALEQKLGRLMNLSIEHRTGLVIVGMLDLCAAFSLVEALLRPVTERGRWRVRALLPPVIIGISGGLIPAAWRESPRDLFVWGMLVAQAAVMIGGAFFFVRRIAALLRLVALADKQR